MSQSNAQTQTPYPSGAGGNGVPVLFALRNVQPSIVAGGASIKSNNSTQQTEQITTAGAMPVSSTTEPLQHSLPESKVESTSTVASTIRKVTHGNSNRFHNSVIVLLILVLCALGIHNSRTNKSTAVTKIDDLGTQVVDSTTNPSVSESKLPLIPDLGSAASPLLVGPTEPGKGLLIEPLTPTQSPTQELSFDSRTMGPQLNVSSDTQNQVTAKPPAVAAPLLLGSPMTSKADNASPERPTNGSVPATNVAYQPSLTNDNGQKSVALMNDSQIVDTGTNLSTEELKNIFKSQPRGNQAPKTSEPSPTATYSAMPTNGLSPSPTNPGPYMSQTSAQIMAGQPYPSPAKDYVPLTVPAYERNLLGSAPGLSSAQTIRQPSNGSNRYQGLSTPPPSTPSPAAYVPLGGSLPNTSGNSVGYPPSN